MKTKLLIVFFLISFVAVSFAQTEHILFYENGNLKEVGQ